MTLDRKQTSRGGCEELRGPRHGRDTAGEVAGDVPRETDQLDDGEQHNQDVALRLFNLV